ncbi:MAG: hypothetical protein R3A44_22720 [Caldilineaceae bacterium]
MTLGRLRSYLPAQFPSLTQSTTQLASAVIWLPSQDGAPIARRAPIMGKIAQTTAQVAMSTALGDDAQDNGSALPTPVTIDQAHAALENGAASAAAAMRLTPWQVTGVMLPAAAALELLCQITEEAGRGAARAANRSSALHHLRLGSDLLYWSHAAKFALELLIGQHYVPGVYADAAGQFASLWQPMLNEPQIGERFDQLVMHMPPICRAYNLATPAQAFSARALLEDFMTSVVDVSVRPGWMLCRRRPRSSRLAQRQTARIVRANWRDNSGCSVCARPSAGSICRRSRRINSIKR